MDAYTMARAVRPPEVVLPRLGWLPFLGPLCARVLPPRRWVGRVLSWQEFDPFRQGFTSAFLATCRDCGAARTSCSCTEALKHERAQAFLQLLKGFLKAQGLPWRPVWALPGAVFNDVVTDLFQLQTRANIPRRKGTTSPTSTRPLQQPGDDASASTRLPSSDPQNQLEAMP